MRYTATFLVFFALFAATALPVFSSLDGPAGFTSTQHHGIYIIPDGFAPTAQQHGIYIIPDGFARTAQDHGIYIIPDGLAPAPQGHGIYIIPDGFAPQIQCLGRIDCSPQL